MIQYIKTTQHFDILKMQKEVAQLSAGNWKAHYNTSHYEGDWSVLPLRSINGSLENAVAVHAASSLLQYNDTALLQACPYFKAIIDSFACEKTSVRLMKLNAGAVIKEHTDYDMNIEAGEARFHIPVQTNKDVAFFIMEDRIPMLEGECWYLNLSLPHRVQNAGSEDRVHLVIDCLVNDWVRSLLNEPGVVRKDTEGVKKLPGSIADKQKIIAELRLQNTPGALQLASRLEGEIN